jgi:hypothetical protein
MMAIALDPALVPTSFHWGLEDKGLLTPILRLRQSLHAPSLRMNAAFAFSDVSKGRWRTALALVP